MTIDEAPVSADEAGGRAPLRREASVWTYLAWGIGWGLVALVALAAVAVFGVPAVTGAHRYAIMGGSMEPAVPLGALVVVKPTPIEDVRAGDVVTFQLRSGESAVATHRVVGIGVTTDGARVITTKGDANELPDTDPVREEQLRGVVMYTIPLLGYTSVVITSQVQAWLTPVVVAVLAGYAVWMFASAWRDRRRRRGDAGDGVATGSATPRGLAERAGVAHEGVEGGVQGG